MSRPWDRNKRLPIERPQRPIAKRRFFAIVTLMLGVTVTLLGLILRGVPTEPYGVWPHLLLLLVVAMSVVASLAITEIIPWGSRSFRDWSRPKVLGSVVALNLAAVGLAAGLAQIFNAPAATQKDVQQLDQRLQEAGVARGPGSLIEQHISGRWGEPGCQVTYDLALANGLLTVASRQSVPGQSPLNYELQSEPGMGARLVTSVIEPLRERGDQHEFVYEQAGARQFLTWVIKKREISLKLDRCAQG